MVSSSGQGSGGQSWPTVYNLWTGTIHMWPGSDHLAPLPSRPQQQQLTQQQQAMLAYPQALLTAPQLQTPSISSTPSITPSRHWTAPTVVYYTSIANLLTWDQQSIALTFSIVTLNEPQNNE